MNMKWTALLLALVGCQASLGDPQITADASPGQPDGSIVDAARILDAPVVPDGPVPDAQLCNAGDANVEDPATGHCYMLFQTIENWATARMRCAALGSNVHLAVLTSVEENTLVAPLAGLLDVWVGANDIDNEGVWVWINAELFAYDNWRSGEPNNAGGVENCMIIEGELGGTWDDRPCDVDYAYLCERE